MITPDNNEILLPLDLKDCFFRWQGGTASYSESGIQPLFNDIGEKQTFCGEIHQMAAEIVLPCRLRVGRNKTEEFRALLLSHS